MKKTVPLWIDHPQAIMVITLNRGEELNPAKSAMHSDFHLLDAASDKISSSFDEDFNPNHANPVLDDISLILLLEPNEATRSFRNPLSNKVFVSLFSLANRPKR